jgi:ATP-dependent Lon protease
MSKVLYDYLKVIIFMGMNQQDYQSNPTEHFSDTDRDNLSSDDIEISISQTTKNEIPEEVPILPLRGLVVFPDTALPLTIGQPRSIKLIDDITLTDRLVGLVSAKNPDLENPGPDDLYMVGTLSIVHRLFKAPDGTIRLLVQGLSRITIGEYTKIEPYLKAKISSFPEVEESGIEIEALVRNCRDQFEHITEMIPSIPRELVSSVLNIEDPLQSVYNLANLQRMALTDAQEILELPSVRSKLHRLLGFLTREADVLELGQKIQNEARSEIEKIQREYFLHEQIKAIQKELGETDSQAIEIESLRKKLLESDPPKEAKDQAEQELEKLSHLTNSSPEFSLIRTYLDWIINLPWQKTTLDDLDITHARKILDKDHFGLDEIKDRILEYLSVRKLRLERKEILQTVSKDSLRKDREGVILCFIGPPGVGKTSLGQSIAHAMGREFIRISLGGLHDEAEIRGHRRTYIGAMPGRIIQSMRRVNTKNPVFMMDEIDKLAFDFHGDPSSALLEVLDPEQNSSFRDNYLEVPFDLSQVMFITTANSPDTIPQPLLDRMEVIHLSGYTENEKLEIAKRYLVPRQTRENGLLESEVHFLDSAILSIIRSYTRESGVRGLERTIGTICRKITKEVTENKKKSPLITNKRVRKYLGKAIYREEEEINRRTAIPGVATGLAWTPYGGEILFIEATKMPGSKGFQITGSIGNVMQESAKAALSYVRAHTQELGIEPEFYEKNDLHLHIPSGAQPKDGPSAGVTLVAALVSLLINQSVNSRVAMTGEITLRGQVLPVGGIKEKVLAAYRAGIRTIFLPKDNLVDLEEIPNEIRQKIKFIGIESMDEIVKGIFSEIPSVGTLS